MQSTPTSAATGQPTSSTSSTRRLEAFRTSRSHPVTSGRSARADLATDQLLDTDVCSDHLRGVRQLDRALEGAWYSVITRFELYAGEATEESRVDALLSSLNEIPFDGTLAMAAGRLRRTFGLRVADAIVAGTAIENALELVTRN